MELRHDGVPDPTERVLPRLGEESSFWIDTVAYPLVD
jgi:hypothetical protein